jgi:hypothetical protein
MGVKTGMGRLSNFSSEFEVQVPKDLKNVTYEPTEDGTYLYVCTDFMPERRHFFLVKRKLLL